MNPGQPVDQKAFGQTIVPVPGSEWFLDRASNQYFYYDRQSDTLVLESGQRVSRPHHIRVPTFANSVGSGISSQSSSASAGYQYGTTPSSSMMLGNSQVPIGTLAQGLQTVSLRDQSSSSGSQAGGQTLQTASRHVRADSGQDFVTLQDPASQVQIAFVDGPAERITDPLLLRHGIRAERNIIPVDNQEQEALFPAFRVRDPPREFFTVGRVFTILWVESAGESNINDYESSEIVGRFGEKVVSKIRRFVVIREGQTYCTGLPISNYDGQGVGKHGIKKSDHAIIYTRRDPPKPMKSEQPARGEAGMRSGQIKVDPDDREWSLDPNSRLDFGSVYTIQHNIKVRGFGRVNPKSMNALLHQFSNRWQASANVQSDSRSSGAKQSNSISMASASEAQAPSNSQTSGDRRSRPDAVQGSAPLNSRPSAGAQNHSGSNAEVLRAEAEAAVKRFLAAGYSKEQAIAAVRAGYERMQRPNASSRNDNDSDEDSSGDDSDEE